MPPPLGPAHRYVFVAGLHRTGTSLLAKIIGSHPRIAAIEGAPVPENEGCYLQGAIPHTALDGIPGHFATDPQQHYTEKHALNTLETKLRLDHEWGEWFDRTAPWRLEKSPVNLIRMRLLQALFPLSSFIVITRHPQFMAQALQKWTDQDAATVAKYGVEAYRLVLDDLRYLHRAIVIRYEDFVKGPDDYLKAIGAFLSVEPDFASPEIRDGNADYQAAEAVSGEIDAFGYRSDGTVSPFNPIIRHSLRDVREKTWSAIISKPS